MHLHIVLFEPEIPHNTGNIIRLCANTGATLHLIHPLGFAWDNARLRRAGLDYFEWIPVQHHMSLDAFRTMMPLTRLLAVSTRGTRAYHEIAYQEGDALLFGPESRGLPTEVLQEMPPGQVLRIPMQPASRSLNLANATAVILYEAWRQFGFVGGR
ncbi:MAG: tRNA (cytidine(34)-2'-O)-methyltransferase [Candidatus Tectomicrobia bacterium]|uniref:Putative tRNA (cytidine(34)-2'-O)-methyltransferase n=1 Tax=Tectimicrobiota bacterium TaxID=2528274 RepID=A0A938B0F4_UNCTE|nr:tRNA (cytidine(34)-2'-O)-methyltransferase [Candidatus Tectomicrobia bacterium]